MTRHDTARSAAGRRLAGPAAVVWNVVVPVLAVALLAGAAPLPAFGIAAAAAIAIAAAFLSGPRRTARPATAPR